MDNRIKIIIFTAMYNRPKISTLFGMSMDRLIKHYTGIYNIKVHAVISDDSSKEVCEKFNISYNVAENKPVGRKFNKGLEYIVDNFEFDYVMIMGDDDIVSSSVFEVYKKHIDDKVDHFGVNKIYYFDTSTKKSLHFKYQYDTDKLMGCCRMLSKKAIINTGYQSKIKARKPFSYLNASFVRDRIYTIPTYQARYLNAMGLINITEDSKFQMWHDGIDKGLDNCSEMNLLFSGFPPTLVDTDTLVTDVKSSQNIWDFRIFLSRAEPVSNKQSLSFFSDDEIEYIKQTF